MTGTRRDKPRSVGVKATRPGFWKPLQLTRPGPAAVRTRTRFGRGCPGRASRVIVLVVTAPKPSPMARAPSSAPASLAAPGFDFGRDTFAFRNEIRARHPDTPDLYANYCFVLARAMRQFFLFARFDPSQPKLDPAEYVERIRLVVSEAPWHGARPPDRSEEHTSELQSQSNLVCRLLLEK